MQHILLHLQNRFCSLLLPLLLITTSTQAQKTRWSLKQPLHSQAFIENKGQFDGKDGQAQNRILYGTGNFDMQVYFTTRGFTCRFNKKEVLDRESVPAKEEEPEQEKGGRESKKIKFSTSSYQMEWAGANKDVQLEATNKLNEYFSYGNPVNPHAKGEEHVHGFARLVYKNLYPNIDLEYTFPEGKDGIEYSFILHPGADPSLIQMKYSGDVQAVLSGKDLHFISALGTVTDHAPQSYYTGTREALTSGFELNRNTVRFHIQAYDHSRTVTIDPWSVNPALAVNDKVYDVDKDARGNIYVYGGSGNYLIRKFTAAGVPVWTYTSTFTGWFGDMVVDPAGNCFFTEGYDATNNHPNLAKIDSSASLKYSLSGRGLEYWCLCFSCDFSELTVSGGVGSGYLSLINQASGIVSGTVSVAPTEPRGMSKAPNGNFYCVTQNGGPMVEVSSSFVPGFSVPSGFSFPYSIPTLNTSFTSGSDDAGYNCIATGKSYIYSTNGVILQRFSISNGTFQNSVPLPGGVMTGNGGVLVDNCGNVYAGSQAGVYRFDSLLNPSGSAATSGAVYALCPGAAPGELIACGDGFLASVALSYCSSSLTLTTSSVAASCTVPGSGTVSVSGGSGTYQYLWIPGNQTTPTITGVAPGTYTVYVSDPLNCGGGSSATVTIGASAAVPVPSVVSTTRPCPFANTGSIQVNVSGGTGPYTYSWSPSGGSTPAASSLSPGTYVVHVNDSNGCKDSLSVTLSALIHASIAGNNSICSGDTVTLTSSAGTSYSWNTGQVTQSILVQPSGTTTYTVTLVSGGCTDTAMFTVHANPPPPVSISGTTSICSGSFTTLFASGTGTGTYSWNTGNISSSLLVSPPATTTYTVWYSTSAGCQSFATATVTVIPMPAVVVTGPTTVCAGQSIVLTASGATTWSWSTGQTTASITVSLSSSTNYLITGSNGACWEQIAYPVTVIPNPVANAGASVFILSGQHTTLIGSGGGTYSWSPPNDLSCTLCADPVATPPTTTTYTLTVTNTNGCTSTDTVTVSVQYILEVPNVFTPNGDGVNDAFRINSRGLKAMSCILYDRWGRKVYEWGDLNGAWNGKLDNGSLASDGTYYFMLQVTLPDGKQQQANGFVELIR
ncbi:MAG: gliding motility-associated C-terminal domain-containing protein [Bacteroidia bacterium]